MTNISSKSGLLGTFNLNDWYSFTVTGTQIVTIDLSVPTSGSAYVQLDDSNLKNIAQTSSATSTGDQALVETLAAGTYYVNVTGQSSAATPFTLAVSNAQPPIGTATNPSLGNKQTSPISAGTLGTAPVDEIGYFPSSGLTEYYSFSLAGPAMVNAILSGLTASASLALLNAAGQTIASTSNGSFANLIAPLTPLAAGTYFIAVTSQSNTPTGFNLAMTATPINDSAGQSSSAAFALGNLDTTPANLTDPLVSAVGSNFYSFTVGSPSRLSVTLSNLTASAGLQLLDAAGHQLATTSNYSNSSATSSNASLISTLSPLPTGTYFLEVSPTYSNTTTSYTLNATATPIVNQGGTSLATATPIALSSTPSTPINDFVGPTTYTAVYYKLTLAIGNTLNVELSPGQGDVFNSSVVNLLNSGGTSIAYAPATQQNAGLIQDTLAAGTYYLEVQPYYSNTDAPYTLIASLGAPATGTAISVDLGTTLATAADITSNVARGTPILNFVGGSNTDDIYKFTTASASVLRFNLVGLTQSISFTLEDSSGKEITAANNGNNAATSLWSEQTAGTYFIDIHANNSAGTGYNLLATSTPINVTTGGTQASATALTLSTTAQTVTGNVGASNQDAYYKFTLAVNSTITALMTASTSSSLLNLYDVSGNRLGYVFGSPTGNASLIQTLAAGTYFLDPNYNGNPPSDYALTVTAAPVNDAAAAASPNARTPQLAAFGGTPTVPAGGGGGPTTTGGGTGLAVTVAGAGGATSTITFDTQANADLARALAANIVAATAVVATTGGTLGITGTETTLIDAASVAITAFGGSTANETVLAGAQPIAFIAQAGSGTLVGGGGGNSFFSSATSGNWNINLGNGANTVTSGANDTIAAGTGANRLFLNGISDQVTAIGQDTIVAGAGAATIASTIGNTLFFGGAGTADFIAGSGISTLVGGSGAMSVSGGSTGLLFFGNGPTTYTAGSAADTLVGSTGSLTVQGGAAKGIFFGGSAGNNLITSGSGGAIAIGGGAGDVLTATGSGANLFAAGAGAETINAAGSSGANTFFAGSGADFIALGAGETAAVTGPGNDTVAASTGTSLILFVNGNAGHTTITGWDASHDFVALAGYAGNADAAAFASAQVAGGSSVVSLPDGTQITFAGITQLQSFSFH